MHTKSLNPALPATIVQVANGYIVRPEYADLGRAMEWSEIHVFATLAEVFAWLESRAKADA